MAVGSIFAVSAVTVLRSTVAEANEARERAELVLAELRRASDRSSIPAQAAPVDPPTDTTAEPDRIFVFRAHEGRIGIFTAEGYLIRTLDVDVCTLPSVDRDTLENDGMTVHSREEMDALIEDLQQ